MSEEENIVPPVPDLDPEEQRRQWGELLGAASDYHYDMSGQFEPEDPDDDPEDMAIVARVHRAWGAAIAEAIHLIASMAEEQIEVEIDPNQGKAKNITKDAKYEQE
tara:strand:+ start:529 stop:846 length:318 start_codon:yes stop_codon:yes gene_type:complete